MSSFLQTIAARTNLQLEELAIGWGSESAGVLLVADFDIALPELLKSIGFELPGKDGLEKNKVSIQLAYERSRGDTEVKGSTILAKITITDPLKLSQIMDTGGFNGLPELKLVELVFELDAAKTEEESAKNALIGFKMCFSTEGRPGTTVIEAVYEKKTDSAAESKLTVNKKFRAVMSSSPEGGDSVTLDFKPHVDLVLHIQDLFFLQTSQLENEKTTEATTLFGIDLDLDTHLDLSKLPLVGKDLADTQLRFESFRVLYSPKDIKLQGLKTVNQLLGSMHVPEVQAQKSPAEREALKPESQENQEPENGANPVALKKGFNFHGTIQFGDLTIELFSGSREKDQGKVQGNALKDNDEPATEATASETPAPVGKKIGPVTIHSLRMALKHGFHLDLTASLALGPLELDLMGFSMEFPIALPHKKEEPAAEGGLTMSIQGMNIRYNKPPLTIDGGFLRQEDESQGVKYSGALAIGLKSFQLVAFGSYGEQIISETEKYKTFFVYGFLATPPLGPPILQLTGVALGFGYNRQLILPEPEYIDEHPLVSPVLSGFPPDFDHMNEVIPPSKGDYWAAVGIRIESFKMMNTFVLAIFKFGHEFEIDLLGRVSLVLPKNPRGSATTPALAKLEIGIVATILPERGVVEINGSVLPGSYIFEPSAVLSGGFAVLVITKDQSFGKWNGGKAGDFVVSFGGYSPYYKPKPYYPQNIKRMALNWKPYANLDVSAEMYFAVVPEAFMFGGHLSVNFNAGGKFSIVVHFEAGLDFIVWWQPKRYIGHAYANLQVGATVWFIKWRKVEFDLSGDLTFWGPPFAGHASFKVHVLVTFTVDVDFGPAQTAPRPIAWEDFMQTLLPEKGKVVSTALSNGLLGKIEIGEETANETDKKTEKQTIYLVNPKDFELEIASAFPVKQINGKAADIKQQFGIAPMAAQNFGSDLRVSITKDGQAIEKIEEHFTIVETSKNYPAAAWQEVAQPGVIPAPPPQDKNLLELCGGLVLKGNAPKKGDPSSIPVITFDTISVPTAPWEHEEFTYAA